MAKLTGRGGRFEEIARVEKDGGQRVLRSDGWVLSRFRYSDGTWSTWHRVLRMDRTRDEWVAERKATGWVEK